MKAHVASRENIYQFLRLRLYAAEGLLRLHNVL
jgi:hypothetical protein